MENITVATTKVAEVEAFFWEGFDITNPEYGAGVVQEFSVDNHCYANTCADCGYAMGEHGWLPLLPHEGGSLVAEGVGGYMVCPKSWVVKTPLGNYIPLPVSVFEKFYRTN